MADAGPVLRDCRLLAGAPSAERFAAAPQARRTVRSRCVPDGQRGQRLPPPDVARTCNLCDSPRPRDQPSDCAHDTIRLSE